MHRKDPARLRYNGWCPSLALKRHSVRFTFSLPDTPGVISVRRGMSVGTGVSNQLFALLVAAARMFEPSDYHSWTHQ
jgi:hypothetical protein